ncbi:uncharacterized protein LOC131316419 [Rhododendron vialii]|uniref:uncharacterized protein LOC131316419 n=1 Tax=Rhododendron vialii TaxID=182163 RepID=UPI00265F5110|nr:uncharacterized protein LOC131316419 [Rhododendron vialii]
MKTGGRSYVDVVSAMCLALFAIFAIGQSHSRELRPSAHGLAYQSNSTAETAEESSEMQSFFGDTAVPLPAIEPLPEAKNTSDAPWWKDVSGAGQRRGHVREALEVVAVVCGVTGVGCLVVAALVFVFRHQRQRSTGTDK